MSRARDESRGEGEGRLRRRGGTWIFGVGLVLLLGVFPAEAARISELSESTVWEQMVRFFQFRDPSVRYALIGSILLGISCGVLGSFIVVRKMALFGDALSHAVLPGVALGFLWDMTKNPVTIFIGATIAGLIGAAMVHWIKETTRLKEDTALGLVLASFYAVGVALTTMINQLPTGNQTGIDKFMFGQAAAIGADDVKLMVTITALVLLCMALLYKEFLLTSFDAQFARAIGLPAQAIHYLLMLLLAFSVVISLQAVGVVLVSAMLITPAATAYLLTDRMHRMIFLAALFGVLAGGAGAFVSFLDDNLATGPIMVLAASSLFVLVFCFGPRHGVVMRWWRQRSNVARISRENTLKAIYHVLESRDFEGEGVSLRELAERRKETLEESRQLAEALRGNRMATVAGDDILLTPSGWSRACEIVRNHRLWELYLTNEAKIASDHVHEDAEHIEHVLGEEVVRELERKLKYARQDPHGKPIPGLSDIRRGTGSYRREDLIGYGDPL